MAVMVMVVALLANATYVQVIKADDLRADPRNSRVLLDEYSRQRGQISASGQVLAASRATDDRYKYLREYPNPYPYAPVTGFYSMQYGSAGLERTEDPILNGSDNRLFSQRFFDLVSGRDPRGGNVVTTLNPAMQQVAYDQLTSKGYTGSVVAIEPSTGRILTMVSTPSYDPNLLASHDGAETTKAWDELNADPNDPLVNRAISQTYPPGSTFKVLTTAAALGNGATPDDQLTAAPQITLPGTSTTLENYNGSTCGPNPTASLRDAFARSCNTAFVELGIKDGADAIKDEASAFGIGPNTPRDPAAGCRQHGRRHLRRRGSRPDQHRPARRRGDPPARECSDRRDRRQRWCADAAQPDLPVAGTGSDRSQYAVTGVDGSGDLAGSGGNADRSDDRLGELHRRRRQDPPRRSDRVQDRYRRARREPAGNSAARLVHRFCTGAESDGRRGRHRRERW